MNETVRESIARDFQRWANRPPEKHSRNRPLLRVGLPNTHQIISVFSSVRAPSVTSQMTSGMAEASSNTTRMRLPWLCRPAKASVFRSLHGTISMRQVFSWSLSLAKRAVAVSSNSSLPMKRRYHFATSAHVFVFSWFSVLAVTTPFVPSKVEMAQRTIQATRADLPIPWPEVRAS